MTASHMATTRDGHLVGSTIRSSPVAIHEAINCHAPVDGPATNGKRNGNATSAAPKVTMSAIVPSLTRRADLAFDARTIARIPGMRRTSGVERLTDGVVCEVSKCQPMNVP
jgi:hypothetical protein